MIPVIPFILHARRGRHRDLGRCLDLIAHFLVGAAKSLVTLRTLVGGRLRDDAGRRDRRRRDHLVGPVAAHVGRRIEATRPRAARAPSRERVDRQPFRRIAGARPVRHRSRRQRRGSVAAPAGAWHLRRRRVCDRRRRSDGVGAAIGVGAAVGVGAALCAASALPRSAAEQLCGKRSSFCPGRRSMALRIAALDQRRPRTSIDHSPPATGLLHDALGAAP